VITIDRNAQSSAENAQTRHSSVLGTMSSARILQGRHPAVQRISLLASIPCCRTRRVGSLPPISTRSPGCRMLPRSATPDGQNASPSQSNDRARATVHVRDRGRRIAESVSSIRKNRAIRALLGQQQFGGARRHDRAEISLQFGSIVGASEYEIRVRRAPSLRRPLRRNVAATGPRRRFRRRGIYVSPSARASTISMISRLHRHRLASPSCSCGCCRSRLDRAPRSNNPQAEVVGPRGVGMTTEEARAIVRGLVLRAPVLRTLQHAANALQAIDEIYWVAREAALRLPPPD
jgi:hypothetical protein